MPPSAVILSSDPHWLEVINWIAQTSLVFIAVAAAVFARNQVREMNNARAEQLRVLNATLLMELDKRWDSVELQGARRLFQDSAEDIQKIVSSSHPLSGDTDKQEKVKQEWKRVLSQFRAQDKENYSKLLSILGFFETVGLMVDKNYISVEDAMDLFKGPIIQVGVCFGGHIEDRAKEMGVPAGLYEHAMNLYKRATTPAR